MQYLRLLPAVAVVGTGLLAIKAIDLARAAPDSYAEPDNRGLAPAASRPAAPDFASDTTMPASAAEVDVTSSLARRRAELDARERGLNMRQNILNAGEARVDQKIAALKQMQAEMQALLAQRDAKQDQQIASLVKTYSAMKPKDAARIFNSLNEEVLLPVAKGMKSDVLAPVMAAMIPEAAQRLTVKLAALLKLPETPSTCPLAATMPTSTAMAAPLPPDANPVVTPDVPLQTASLAPSPAVTPLAPVTAAATPPATVAAAPPPQPAALPAKPRRVAVHHAPPAASPPPAKPVAAATAPAKPDTTTPSKPAAAAAPAPTAIATTPPQPSTAPPSKPETAAASPTPTATPPKPTTAAATPNDPPAAPAITTPAKPPTQAASGPPTATAPPTASAPPATAPAATHG
jgi:flagellar motility protein MotE (MotC chaperone)